MELETTKLFSVVIPAYNEEQGIGDVVHSLHSLAGLGEILVVNDGSTDQTSNVAKQNGANVIEHAYNRGYGASLKTGIRKAQFPYILLCDADGQHQIEDIKKVATLATENEMVVGARIKGKGNSIVRAPGKLLLRWFASHLVGIPIPDLNSGLRTFNRHWITKSLHLMPDGFSFSTTSTMAMFSNGGRVHYEPITCFPRLGRKSTLSLWRDGWNTLHLITRITVLFAPMKVFLPMAIFFMGSSAVYFSWYISNERVHITPSMVMLFITGVLLFFMGVLSDQISSLRREMYRE